MAEPKLITPENRLAAVRGRDGDPTIESMARAAEKRVAALGPSLRAHVNHQCRLIRELAAADDDTLLANAQAIGEAARSVCEVAGAAGMSAAGEAARGIFAMIDAWRASGLWHAEGLRLHVGALALLQTDCPPGRAESEKILARLKAMREWAGVGL